jgi:MoxR-like ATPase
MLIPDWVAKLKQSVHRHVCGQEKVIDRLILALACRGHVLLEGVPGLAKTRLASVFSRCLGLGFRRIQFTSDMLPGDILGGPVYVPQTGEFRLRKGPIFSQVILADELNRAPPRTHSALLEAMQDRQVSLADETIALGDPFLVIATQNPIEWEGVYPLSEAEKDRFLFRMRLDYPNRTEEVRILEAHSLIGPVGEIEAVLDPDQIRELPKKVDGIHVARPLMEYLVDLVRATRSPQEYGGLKVFADQVRLGASPRAGVQLLQASKARALVAGRDMVLPEDIQDLFPDVMGHRVEWDWRAADQGRNEAGSGAFLHAVLREVAVP